MDERTRPESPLARRWWFPGIEGFRPGVDDATFAPYGSSDLDGLPRVDLDGSLQQRLASAPRHREWTILDGDGFADPVRRLTPEGLDELLPGGVEVPSVLAWFAADPDRQRRIRSMTGCQLDLGDRAVPSADGGVLFHLLSDQQWLLHWYVHLTSAGGERVLVGPIPYGFDLPEDDPALEDARGEDGRIPELAGPVPLDGSVLLEICADSVEEFLLRFWIENEIGFAVHEDEDVPAPFAPYAASLAASRPGPEE